MIKESSRKGRVLNTTFLALLFILQFFSACVWQDNKLVVTGLKSAASAKTISVSQVTVNGSGQLIISGQNLEQVTNLQITGQESWTFSILAQSTSSLTLQALNNSASVLQLAAGGIYNFLFSTAYASTPVSVVYTIPANTITTGMIQAGAVTAAKLANMGAAANQVLQFDGLNWVPSTLPTGLTYLGAWDASTNAPVLVNGDCTVGTSGEYYIVSTAGASTLGGISAWGTGDWLICSSAGTWQKIINSGATDLNSLSGVAIAAETTNHVLKYSGGGWINAFLGLGELSNVDLTTTPPANGNLLSYSTGSSKWIPTQLPTCTASEVLKSDGVSFVCVTDNTGAGAFSGAINRVVITSAGGTLTTSAVTTTELGYVAGVTSSIQTQINAKLSSYTETDPGVTAFAKAALPTCGAGTVLKGDGTTLTCVTDSTTDATKLPLTGGALTGNLAMGANNITGVADPVLAQDAATKAYVDSLASATNVESEIANDVTTGYMPYDNGTKLVSSGLFWDNVNGRLGIGTSTPLYPLDIMAPLGTLRLNSTTDGLDMSLRFDTKDSGSTTRVGYLDFTPMLGTNQSYFSFINQTGTNLATFKSDGNIGFGTTAPTSFMQLGTPGVNDLKKISIPGVYNFENIFLGQYGNGTAGLEILNHTSAANSYGAKIIADADSGVIGLQFQMASTQSSSAALTYSSAMTILTDNKIGIGTTVPTEKLSVAGKITATHICASNGSNCLDLTIPWNDTTANSYVNNSDVLNCAANEKLQMTAGPVYSWSCVVHGTYWDTDKLGVGVVTPTKTISVAGDAAKTIGQERNPAANTAGNNLTINSGGATSGATDKNGGSLILAGGAATGTGTSDIHFQTATAAGSGTADNAPTTKMTILGNGNVGIGTTSPAAKLDVIGSAKIGNSADALYLKGGTADHVYISYYADAAAQTTRSAYVGFPGAASKSFFLTNEFDNTGTFAFYTTTGGSVVPRFNISNAGLIGIGTTTPNHKLDVITANNDDAFNSGIQVSRANSGTTPIRIGNYMKTADFRQGGTLITNESMNLIYNQGASTFGFNIFNNTADNAIDTTTPVFRIDSSGNVGIGTATPSSKLQVIGGTIRSDLGTTGTSFISTGTGSNFQIIHDGTSSVGVFNSSGGPMQFRQSDGITNSMTISGAGSVGIGTTVPGAKLDVASAGTDTILRITNTAAGGTVKEIVSTATASAAGGGKLSIGVPGTSQMVIDSSGYVGIGTTSPSAYSHGGTNNVVENHNSATTVHAQSHFIVSTGSILPSSSIGSFTGALPNATAANKGVGYISFLTGATSTAANPTGEIIFGTRSSSEGTFAQKMKLTEDGNLGVGTTVPKGRLDVAGGYGTNKIFKEVPASQADYSYYYLKLFKLSTGIGWAATTFNGKICAVRSNDLSMTKCSEIYASRSYDSSVYFSELTNNVTLYGAFTPVVVNDGGFDWVALMYDAHTSAGIVSWTIDGTLYNANAADVVSFTNIDSTSTLHSALTYTARDTSIPYGRLGVGAQSPITTLQVNTSVSGGAPASTTATPNGIMTMSATGTNVISNMGIEANTTPQYFWIQPRHLSAAATYYNTILNPNGGNVGIGSTGPLTALDLGLVGGVRFKINPGSYTNVAGILSGLYHNDSLMGSYIDGGSAHGFISTGYNNASRKFSIGGASSSDFSTAVFEPALTYTNDSKRIGIGTTDPLDKLHVSGGGILLDNNNLIKQKDEGGTIRSILGTLSDGSVLLYGYHQNPLITAVNGATYLSGGTSTNMTLAAGGNVGIGTYDPSHKLHVIGTAGLSTGTAWTNTSDRRLKDIHGAYEHGLDEILKLDVVKFSYKINNPLGLPSDKEIVGFVAQEVQKVIPEAIVRRDDGYLELNVDPIHWAAINAIKDLDAIIAKNYEMFMVMHKGLEKRMTEAERKIASLENEVDTLRAKNLGLEQRLLLIERKLEKK